MDNLKEIKDKCLVVDIETSAHYSNGREISIKTNFNDYVENAKVKWVGLYSYQDNQTYLLDAQKDTEKILSLFETHNIYIGFNCDEFDFPILKNNGFIDLNKYYKSVDCMVVLGKNNHYTKDGFAYKNRAELMEYKLKSNSLKHVAEVLGVEHQKGDIDYSIFHKDTWLEDEIKEIKKYLQNDVLATKQLFDKLWSFWLPFTNFIDDKSIYDLSWIRNSIASLTYKSACYTLGVEPTYSDKQNSTEEMGGRVIEPKYEELQNIWYCDFASLYPHIFAMFNLFSEVDKNLYPESWNGNSLFKTKGYYDIATVNPLSITVSNRLKERILLQQEDKKNPMVYALKIWLNSLYGASRSSVFEKIHTDNCGWDCCWLGQQIHEHTADMLDTFGFELIYADTDSFFIKAKDEKYNNREYLQKCLDEIISMIKDNVPFPVNTFSIKIEHYIDYIMFPFSEQPIIDKETGKNKKIKNRLVKEFKGKKKNYIFLYKNNDKDTLEIIGLPIKKDNATPLGMKIFYDVLEKEIIKQKKAKFSREYIDNIINEYLQKDEALDLLAIEYKVKPFRTYKKESQIQAQISKNYLSGDEGVIRLIKNKKIGDVGLGTRYCTIEEAKKENLLAEDLDLDKIYNELEPFIERAT